jgi:signal transduction histidine kinase
MESSEGLGWKNLQARTKLIGGKLHIATEKGNGSRFEISVKNQLND